MKLKHYLIYTLITSLLCIVTVQQKKDQIVFYYIPFELVTNKPTLKVV